MALNPDDISRLYRAHAADLLRFFARRTLQPEVAVDLVAETFAQAFADRAGFRGRDDREALAWIFGIARPLQGLAGAVAGKHWRGLSAKERDRLVHLLRAAGARRRLSGGERAELRRLVGKLDPSPTGRSGASSRGASTASRTTPTK